nr:MAG TPA: hypothetical protein [Caudoviricetes sp.]
MRQMDLLTELLKAKVHGPLPNTGNRCHSE